MGFIGRVGVYEAIFINEEIEKAVLNNPSEHEIEAASRSQRQLNMSEDGILKVLKGVTSIEELSRVVDISAI